MAGWRIPIGKKSDSPHDLPGLISVAWSPGGDRIASGAHDAIRIWDASAGKELLTIAGSGQSLAWNPDGKRLAAAGGDNTLRIWDTSTGQERLVIREHTERVYHQVGRILAVAWSPDGRRLAYIVTGQFNEEMVKIADAVTGQEILILRKPKLLGYLGRFQSLAWSPDGHRLAAFTGTDRRDTPVAAWVWNASKVTD